MIELVAMAFPCAGKAGRWEPQSIETRVGHSKGVERFAKKARSAPHAALSSDSPAAGAAVSTTGPLLVMAMVCSKWALGSPSTVDCVQ